MEEKSLHLKIHWQQDLIELIYTPISTSSSLSFLEGWGQVCNTAQSLIRKWSSNVTIQIMTQRTHPEDWSWAGECEERLIYVTCISKWAPGSGGSWVRKAQTEGAPAVPLYTLWDSCALLSVKSSVIANIAFATTNGNFRVFKYNLQLVGNGPTVNTNLTFTFLSFGSFISKWTSKFFCLCLCERDCKATESLHEESETLFCVKSLSLNPVWPLTQVTSSQPAPFIK